MTRRRGTSRVSIQDKRTPVVRMLQDSADKSGMICIAYDQQWKTLWKAQELGWVDANQYITDKGREHLAKFAA